MPNWTSNTLEVCGKPEAVDKFVAHMGDLMDFEKVIPPPENMFRDNLSSEDKDRCAAEGIPTWYEWQSENWGTKWNASQATPVEIAMLDRKLGDKMERLQNQARRIGKFRKPKF